MKTLADQIQSVLAGLESRFSGVGIVDPDKKRIDIYKSISEDYELETLNWYVVKDNKLHTLKGSAILRLIDHLKKSNKEIQEHKCILQTTKSYTKNVLTSLKTFLFNFITRKN